LRLVVAGLAAGWAVVEAVLAEADIGLPLAQATVLFAIALFFLRLALGAAEAVFGGSAHGRTLTLVGGRGKCRW
jgi:hypothetical protein